MMVRLERPGTHESGAAPLDLSVVYTSMNSSRTIGRSIESVSGLARNIVVVDSGSTDGTVEDCRKAGATVREQPWLGYARQKQLSIDISGDSKWVLLLDSDEIVTPELARSIRRAVEQDDPSIDAWHLARRYWYDGGYLRIEYPDWTLRLFRRGSAWMRDTGSPHDIVETAGKTRRLAGDLRHESWASLQDAVKRNLRYAELTAGLAGKRGSMARIAVNGPWAFVRHYLLQGSFADGRRGLEISLVLAMSTAYKHMLRARRAAMGNGEASAGPGPGAR
jgi:glycosyltransferase involved in cell wall biosynthesis